ncbi:hypothetical protein CKO40_20250 [Halochromatium glycolicum]|uniref:Uncharacterized protein n=1 Tax=Halochromatium glycolicum TaxID=85075 RepID=A0AAJ0XBH4_9GAMM|nr:hypothetical protein [Halochromatium glycolicum]
MLALLLSLIGNLGAQPKTVPVTHLDGATVARAKALALDAALLKGWRLAASGRNFVTLETPLDRPATDGPADARAGEPTLLRIDARFSRVARGAEVELRAEEVWRADTTRAWSADITDRYREHLKRSLQSLSDQWQRFIASRIPHQPEATHEADSETEIPLHRLNAERPQAAKAGAPQPHPPDGAAEQKTSSRSAAGSPQTEPRLGVWAFEAERLALAHGCRLTESGAVLIAEDAGTEVHRVSCVKRREIRVRCDRTKCWTAR